jgi:chaperonin cofactor prefoldin/uncharacterized protein YegP (UPF0339 family)
MDQAAFEIVGEAGQWRWQLADGETHIALSAETYGSSDDARDNVERTRAAASTLSSQPLSDIETQVDGAVAFETQHRDGFCSWELRAGEEVLAVPPATYNSKAAAVAAIDRAQQLLVGAVPVYYGGADESTERAPFVLDRGDLKLAAKTLFGRGPRHQQFLDQLSGRIVVMGIRGKSSTTRRLGDVFHRRGYDTLVKITGNRPHMIHNGDHIPINRTGPRVTLYENIKTFWRYLPVLDSYSPEGIGIFENQGITEYTTRMFNQRFVDPDVILLTNIRQDHQDTLGKTRRDIARSFARAVPAGTHVISGEQHPLLNEYLTEEVAKVGGTLTQVDVPEKHAQLIGAETVHAVNEVLEHFDMEPLPDAEVESYLRAIQPEWTRLPGGARIFNAAQVNDIESTEAVRRALAGDEKIVPFVYLRGDRRSRTSSFVSYVNTLIERGLVDTVVAGGDYTNVFAANVDTPITEYPPDADPKAVLDELVSIGVPIVLMGNTVAEFMRWFEIEIERRAKQATHVESEVTEPQQVPLTATVPPTDEPATTDPSMAEPSTADETADREPPVTPSTADEIVASEPPVSSAMTNETGGSEPPAETTVSSASGLFQKLSEREMTDEQQAKIAEKLGIESPEHVSVKIQQLQSQVADLMAYTDALEAFLDEHGTADSVLNGVEADIDDVQSHLGTLSTRVDETTHTQSDISDRLEAVETELTAVSDKADQIDQVRQQVETNTNRLETTTDRLDETEDGVIHLAERLTETTERLEDDISENRSEIETLQQLEGQRLQRDIKQEVDEIEDIHRLKDVLSELSRP